MLYDRNAIQKKFNCVLENSQDICPVKTDKLFDLWEQKKQRFIQAFGGKLIYELPDQVTFELSYEAQNDKFYEFLNCLLEAQHTDLVKFLEVQKKGFFKNETISPYTYNDKKIAVGAKLVKVFKYFLPPEELANWQSLASTYIQENKIKGKLCLSVHPLDFLSLSENNHSWSSCHSLSGDYRSGNLNFLTDECTVICYLKSAEGEKPLYWFKNFSWNSKKWRMLLFVSPANNLVFAGRQYPLSLNLDKISNEILEETIFNGQLFPYDATKQGDWVNWSMASVKGQYKNELCLEEMLKRNILEPAVKACDKPLFFNDLTCSSVYVPLYKYREGIENAQIEPFVIGGDAYCIQCGHSLIHYTDLMLCFHCMYEHPTYVNEDWIFCGECDRRLATGDAITVSGGSDLCTSCADEKTVRCGDCGVPVFSHEAIEVILCQNEGIEYRCHRCNAEIEGDYIL